MPFSPLSPLLPGGPGGPGGPGSPGFNLSSQTGTGFLACSWMNESNFNTWAKKGSQKNECFLGWEIQKRDKTRGCCLKRYLNYQVVLKDCQSKLRKPEAEAENGQLSHDFAAWPWANLCFSLCITAQNLYQKCLVSRGISTNHRKNNFFQISFKLFHLRNKGVFAKCQRVFQRNTSQVSVLMPPSKTNVALRACDGTFAMRGAQRGAGWRSSLDHQQLHAASPLVLFTTAGEAWAGLVILTLNHPLTSLANELVNCGQGLWFPLKWNIFF